MKRVLGILLIVVCSIVIVSCMTGADSTGVKGVWEAESDDYGYRFLLTSDGAYALESYYEDTLVDVEFGSYEYDEAWIYTDSYDFGYLRDGKSLEVDIYGETVNFRLVSGMVRNNTSAAKLPGVWEGLAGRVAFLQNGTLVTMGSYCNLTEYSADSGSVSVEGSENEYMIINSRLYLRDEGKILDQYRALAFDRVTSKGEDQTSWDILVNNNPWHLIDTDEGTNHYIYTFNSNSTYNRVYYNDYDPERKESSGTFSYGRHVVELSDHGNLAYVIVDMVPFMFSI